MFLIVFPHFVFCVSHPCFLLSIFPQSIWTHPSFYPILCGPHHHHRRWPIARPTDQFSGACDLAHKWALRVFFSVHLVATLREGRWHIIQNRGLACTTELWRWDRIRPLR